MRAVVVREPGPAERLERAELARPSAGAGHVVVRVAAIEQGHLGIVETHRRLEIGQSAGKTVLRIAVP